MKKAAYVTLKAAYPYVTYLPHSNIAGGYMNTNVNQ